MPLFYQHTINQFSKLGIWKIEEEENFFLEKVSIQREISHPHKRLQHLAGRFLLQFLFPDFPSALIRVADTRKPFLSNEAFHFSISHCGDFAAAIVSRENRVGVDIELVTPKIKKITSKFMGDHEMQLLRVNDNEPGIELLTLCWGAKEAMFKWYGNGGVDFKEHMQLNSQFDFDDKDFIRAAYDFSKDQRTLLIVNSKIFGDLVMSFVIS